MYRYTNLDSIPHTFHGVLFKSHEVHDVKSPIQHPKFIFTPHAKLTSERKEVTSEKVKFTFAEPKKPAKIEEVAEEAKEEIKTVDEDTPKVEEAPAPKKTRKPRKSKTEQIKTEE